jgi:perosamine synthetase
VLLGQIERLEDLVQVRIASGQALASAVAGCRWLIPQAVPADYVHSYWTFVCRLAVDVPFTWYDFRAKYLEFGGDGFYGAWALNYLEPAFRTKRFADTQSQTYELGLCPVAEGLQPRLMQFKTNYYDPERRDQAATAMRRTIEFFDRG